MNIYKWWTPTCRNPTELAILLNTASGKGFDVYSIHGDSPGPFTVILRLFVTDAKQQKDGDDAYAHRSPEDNDADERGPLSTTENTRNQTGSLQAKKATNETDARRESPVREGAIAGQSLLPKPSSAKGLGRRK